MIVEVETPPPRQGSKDNWEDAVAKRMAVLAATAMAVTMAAAPAMAGPAAGLTLSSTAFADNAKIPDHYSCAFDHKAGRDVSPPLAWTGAATGVKGYAIVLRDVANGGDKVHWAIWNIPAATASLPEGLASGYDVPNQNGAKQKAMGSGSTALQYFGPCPGGREHPYTFTLYALKSATAPGLSASSGMSQIESAIKKASSANVVLHGKSSAAAN
jgi:Raf kinase inhibitor-like YbhB/YbcL family protein